VTFPTSSSRPGPPALTPAPRTPGRLGHGHSLPGPWPRRLVPHLGRQLQAAPSRPARQPAWPRRSPTYRCFVALAASLSRRLRSPRPPGAESASSLGPHEFFEGQTPTIVAPSLLSLTNGVSSASGPGAGSGSGSGKVKLVDVHVVKLVDASSPKLFAAVAKGIHFGLVTISAQENGSSLSICRGYLLRLPYLQEGASDSIPVESLGIVFARETRRALRRRLFPRGLRPQRRQLRRRRLRGGCLAPCAINIP
jgi:hypothetical protein